MAQITWRNINDPNFTGGNRAIESGNQNLLAGLNQLASVARNVEDRQRQGNTAFAEQQIRQLDQAGLAAALTDPNFIPTDQNVDVTTLRDALAGQQARIDAKRNADFNRAQERIEQADAPIEARLESRRANRTLTIDDVRDSGASPALQARLINALRTDERQDAEFKRADEALARTEENRVQEEQGMGIINQFLSRADELTAQGRSIESIRKQALSEVSKVGNDPKESNALLKVFDEAYESANRLSDESQAQLERLNLDSDDILQAEFNAMERRQEILEKDTPIDKKLSPEAERKALVGLLEKAQDLVPDGSWLTSGEAGGRELKKYINEKSNQGIPTSIIEVALVVNAQSDEEAWGNPVVWKDHMDKTIRELRTKDGREDILADVAAKREELEAIRDNLPRRKRQRRELNRQTVRNRATLTGAFN